MTHHEPDRHTTVVNAGRRASGAGWFIAGGLIVLVLVAIWLLAGGVFDRTTTGSIDMPGELRTRVPDVSIEVNPPAQPMPPAPVGG